MQNNGNTYTRKSTVGVPPIAFTYYGTRFDTFLLSAGWGYDSRNRAIFATAGARHWLNFGYTAPGSDVEFYSLSYDWLQFVPLGRWLTIMNNFEIGYANDIGSTTSIPPYRNFFAGGAESVRGFRASTLGPKDTFGNPYGGNIEADEPVRAAAADAGEIPQFARVSACFSTPATSFRTTT